MPISAPKIPDGLPELMRGLAKSVIKENPENLYVHAAEYFENLIRERDGELERGYQTFNAYQVYADYKEKGREKLGLTKVDGSSISDGEEGDESGSGGSGTKSRGRRRARRARKQSSREKDNPPTMVEKPPSRGTEGETQKLNSLSEESAPPVPVVEQEVVKVHFNPPEAPPTARVVSAQSVEAEQAVSSVLDDEQILDSDGTGGSKDTGDELVDHGDEVGTAPSTAEITEPRAPVEENVAMALQDMETCFMHANVDDLLEKHHEEQMAVDDDSKTAAGEVKILDEQEGEDIPEGPRMVGIPNETLNAPETATQGATEVDEKEGAKEITGNGEKLENESENVRPLGEDTPPTATVAKETGDVKERAKENAPEKQVENMERTKSSDSEAVIERDNVDGDIKTPVEEGQGPPELTGEIVQKDTAHSEGTVPGEVAANAETENKTDLPSDEVSDKQSSQEEPRTESPLEDKPDKELIVSSVIEPGEGQMEQNASADGTGSEQQQIVEPVKIASRMGLDEDETGDDGDKIIEPKSDSVDGTADKVDEKVEEKSQENSSKPNEDEAIESQNDEEQNKAEVKEDLAEIKTIEQNEQSLPGDNNLNAEDGPQQVSNEIEEVDKSLEKPDAQPSAENATNQEPTANEGKKSVDFEKGMSQEKDVPSSPVASPSGVEPVEETVDAVLENELQLATKPEANDIAPGTSIAEVDDGESGENKTSVDAVPMLENQDTKDGNDSSALSAPAAGGDDVGDQTAEVATLQGPEKNISESKEVNDEDLSSPTDEKDDQPREPTADEGKVEDEMLKDQPEPKEAGSPIEGQVSDDLVQDDESVEKSAEKVQSVDGVVEVDPEEKTIETEKENETRSIEKVEVEGVEQVVSDSQDKGNESRESVVDEPNNEEVDPKQASTEGLTLEAVVMDTLPQLLNNEAEQENIEKDDAENGDKKSVTSSQESTNKENDAEGERAKETVEGNPVGNDEPLSVDPAGPELQADFIESSAPLADEPSPEAPPVENVEPGTRKSDESAVASGEQAELESADKREGSMEEVNEEPCVKRNKREASLEEVIEEPCVKREVTPTKSTPPDTDDTGDKQVEELEEIKKVDLSQLSKNSAEALFYSLKKSELENHGEPDGSEPSAVGPGSQESIADDDDKDVVVAEEPPEPPASDANAKRTFTDDFLDEGPITENQPADTAPSDGVQHDPVEPTLAARSSSEAGEQEDEFNPMLMVSMRSKQFQEQLHSRDDTEQGDAQVEQEQTPKRPLMRRCMTEMTGLQRYDTTVDEDPADSRAFDPAYVEEEDQFDGYYIGHIKNKILASSVSVADSDCFDPAQSSEEPVDENNVRTALETIASTDTESTIASQATIQQAGKRSYLRKHSQNTSTNIPYASFGNAAIDKSLDEFIEREEQNKQDEAMAEAATKIQRSYRTHKKRLLRDYHSTMRTCTEDQSAESGEEYAANVIQIKLDQKRVDEGAPSLGDGGGEESDSAAAASLRPHQPLGTGKRPMYSLNIDEYDTVARRMTLTRGVALQRNSTPEDDSGKSANASTDRKPSLNSVPTPESAPASSGSGEEQVVTRSASSEEKSDPPKVEETSVPRSSSGEQEPKEGHSSSRSRPHRTAPAATGREPEHGQPAPKGAGRTAIASLDVQSLLLIARQRTMPVQIDSSVIRVLPKHMRKRISSAGMLNGGGKRK